VISSRKRPPSMPCQGLQAFLSVTSFDGLLSISDLLSLRVQGACDNVRNLVLIVFFGGIFWLSTELLAVHKLANVTI